jgi:hypothetical protein
VIFAGTTGYVYITASTSEFPRLFSGNRLKSDRLISLWQKGEGCG